MGLTILKVLTRLRTGDGTAKCSRCNRVYIREEYNLHICQKLIIESFDTLSDASLQGSKSDGDLTEPQTAILIYLKYG